MKVLIRKVLAHDLRQFRTYHHFAAFHTGIRCAHAACNGVTDSCSDQESSQ